MTNSVKLWTYQNLHAWRCLLRERQLVCQPRHFGGQFTNWRLAFEWISGEMVRRGVSSFRQRWPIWAWHSCDRWLGFPTTETAEGLLPSMGRQYVLIEFDAPDEHVLLSSYGYWNEVIDLALDAFREGTPLRVDESLREAVFDITRNVGADWRDHGNNHDVQACLPRLMLKWVRGVQVYQARDWRSRLQEPAPDSNGFPNVGGNGTVRN